MKKVLAIAGIICLCSSSAFAGNSVSGSDLASLRAQQGIQKKSLAELRNELCALGIPLKTCPQGPVTSPVEPKPGTKPPSGVTPGIAN